MIAQVPTSYMQLHLSMNHKETMIKITVDHPRLEFPGSTMQPNQPFRKWLMKKRRVSRLGQPSTSAPSGSFEFSYKGKRIQDDDTPLSLGMDGFSGFSPNGFVWLSPNRGIDGYVVKAETAVEVTNVVPKREFDEDDPLADGFRKAEAQFLKMQADGFHMNLCIESVDIVKNKYLQERFEEKRKELKRTEGDVKSLLVFHGTPQQNTMSILRDNFDLSKRVNGRKFGDGVYFSEQPEVSIGSIHPHRHPRLQPHPHPYPRHSR